MASRWLADQVEGDEYARWTETDLFDAFRWAVQFIASIKPDAFTRPIDIKLQPGSHQELPDCCNRVTDTLDNAIPTSRRSWRLIDHSRLCPPRRNSRRRYQVREYTYQDESPDSMWVYPPVPEESKGEVFRVICQYDPSPSSLDDDLPVRPSVKSPVLSLMIFYIATGENESASLDRAATHHHQIAAEYLGVSVQEIRNKIAVAREEDVKDAK